VKAEEEAKAKREEEKDVKRDIDAGGESADDEGESTEVEVEGGDASGLEASRASLSLSGFEEGVVRSGREEEGGARQRNVKTQQEQQARGGDLSGEISTDSEWEKVEDGR
jgi:hypothetical protein